MGNANVRAQCSRPSDSHMGLLEATVQKKDNERQQKAAAKSTDTFALNAGAYGIEWATVCLEHVEDYNYPLPSFDMMMDGILKWYSKQLMKKLEGKTPQ